MACDKGKGEGSVVWLIAILLIIAGLMMIFGFWPVALILGGIALLTWWGARSN